MTRVSDMGDLQAWLQRMLVATSPASRLRLARSVAIDLRRSQSRRIAQQRSPDGAPYVPRREPLRAKAGRVRRGAMFRRLASTKHLRPRWEPDRAGVEFATRASRIARVHQDGLVDHVRPGGPRAVYARRELLGFTPADVELIKRKVLGHLAAGL